MRGELDIALWEEDRSMHTIHPQWVEPGFSHEIAELGPWNRLRRGDRN